MAERLQPKLTPKFAETVKLPLLVDFIVRDSVTRGILRDPTHVGEGINIVVNGELMTQPVAGGDNISVVVWGPFLGRQALTKVAAGLESLDARQQGPIEGGPVSPREEV